MAEEADWRLQGQERYLQGASLTRRIYRRYPKNLDWDHDHCVFCFAKFSTDLPNALREGYCTEDEYRWICENCFGDFKSRFNWTVVSHGSNAEPQSGELEAPIGAAAARIREFRERAGLSHYEVGAETGIGTPSVWDLETHDNELSSLYSPTEVRRMAQVLGVRAADLLAAETQEAPVSAVELVGLIHSHCQAHGVTLEQFEDIVGWRLSACIEPPEHLLEDISVDGLHWLCRELGIDWRRIIMGL